MSTKFRVSLYYGRSMKYLLSSLLIAIATTALSACNTIKGVGQDVSAGGRDLTKAAGAVERKIQN